MVLGATSLVAVVVALTGLLVGIGIREELIDNADEVAEVRAEQLAELASQGLLPARIAEAGRVRGRCPGRPRAPGDQLHVEGGRPGLLRPAAGTRGL